LRTSEGIPASAKRNATAPAIASAAMPFTTNTQGERREGGAPAWAAESGRGANTNSGAV
jgi:hypothetical protein